MQEILYKQIKYNHFHVFVFVHTNTIQQIKFPPLWVKLCFKPQGCKDECDILISRNSQVYYVPSPIRRVILKCKSLGMLCL